MTLFLVHPSRTIRIRHWEDNRRARHERPQALVLDPDHDQDPAWSLSCDDQPAAGEVIILTDTPGTVPLLVGDEWAGCLWVGLGKRVYSFPEDLTSGRWVDLCWPVSDLRVIPELGMLIAVHEIGVTAVGADFGIRWSVMTDIITHVDWTEDGVLALKQDVGAALRVDLASGATSEAATSSDPAQ